MTIRLEKGESFDVPAGLGSQLLVGLAWDPTVSAGHHIDLDVSVVMVGDDGKLCDDRDFVFYNNRLSSDTAVQHFGDNRTGEGGGDDEVIRLDLPLVHRRIRRIMIFVTVADAEERNHAFGLLEAAQLRVYSGVRELCCYELREEAPEADGYLVGCLNREGTEWSFTPRGEPVSGGLAAIVDRFCD